MKYYSGDVIKFEVKEVGMPYVNINLTRCYSAFLCTGFIFKVLVCSSFAS